MSEPVVIYITDRQGIFLGSKEARPDPRTPGRVLIPAGATRQPPPTPEDGKLQVFDEQAGTWSLQEDHRGKTGWIPVEDSFQMLVIQEPGPLPEGFTEDDPFERSRPLVVTNLNFTIALIESGILPSQVETFIDGIEDETEREIVRAKWHAAAIPRESETLIALSDQFGLSAEQLDTIFLRALALDKESQAVT